MIKAFIFDFGGVLVRTEDYTPRHAWDERLGLPVGSVERAVHHSDIWIQAQLGRITYRAYWEGVAEILYMSKEDIPELRRDYFSGDRLNYRLVALIRELREQGHPVALLSNESVELRDRLRELELVELFDHILISAEIGMLKPDPTAFRVTLQALQVAPQQVMFVDDALSNIRGAQQLGINAILFRHNTDLRAELKKLNGDVAPSE
ncbi:MAG: HAD family phosphatase [Anaerolineae bacterium]|nr:HAD family phosphatase [Anaerolineae bacterium]